MQVCESPTVDSKRGIRRIPEQPTVLVVEDSDDTRHWLVSVLRQAFPGGSLFPRACVRKSLEVLAAHPVDLAIIDLDLPDGSGIEVIEECIRSNPMARCVIATIYDDDDHILPGLAAGALGYVLKDQRETVLIQQLRLLRDGIPPLAPSVAQRLVRYFKDQPRVLGSCAGQVDLQDDLLRLSEREQQVLRLIAKGMRISEVARLLDITPNTVSSHLKSIYRKRNVSSRAEAALEAIRLGLA